MADKRKGSRTDSSEGKDQVEKSWSESHGGLILVLIVFGGIGILVLFELLSGL